LFAGGENAQGDRQVKTGAFLFDVGGRKVDGGAAHGEFIAGIAERGEDAILGFLDRGVGQADDDNDGVAVTGVDFDLNGVGINAIDGGGTDLAQHHQWLWVRRANATGKLGRAETRIARMKWSRTGARRSNSASHRLSRGRQPHSRLLRALGEKTLG
jgi:hypothetical protein